MKHATISGENRHDFICVDSALHSILEFNQDGFLTREIKTHGSAFDIWMLPNNNLLYCHLGSSGEHGVRVIDWEGNILTDYVTSSEVFSCQPLQNGNILVGELTSTRLVEVNNLGLIEKVINIKCKIGGHQAMRMVRMQLDGTYLVNQPGDKVIRRYTEDGDIIQEIDTLGDTFAVIEKENGNILYTAKEDIVETDSKGEILWRVNMDDIPEIGVKWLTGMQLLPNGNLIVCNWLGHGHEGSGVPIFEINYDKKVVWKFEAPEFTANISNMQLLSLDPKTICFTPTK